MRRREFITLLGGAAAWPLAARAQQAGRLPTIGYLGSTTPTSAPTWTAAFVQRLHELGWIEGRTVTIEYRWAEGHSERYAEFAAELVRLKVDVIATSAAGSYAAKQATSLIPIVVFAVQDLAGRSSFQAGGTPCPGGSTKLSFSLSPVPRSGCGIFVLENMRTRRRSPSASNSAMPMCVEYCGSAIWHPTLSKRSSKVVSLVP